MFNSICHMFMQVDVVLYMLLKIKYLMCKSLGLITIAKILHAYTVVLTYVLLKIRILSLKQN